MYSDCILVGLAASFVGLKFINGLIGYKVGVGLLIVGVKVVLIALIFLIISLLLVIAYY